MNRYEAARYAHQLAAEAIERAAQRATGPDAAAIASALRRIVEQHRRFGPKSTDRAPRSVPYISEPLPLDRETSAGDGR